MTYQAFQPNFSVPTVQFLCTNAFINGTATTSQQLTQLIPNTATTTQNYNSTTFVITSLIFRNLAGTTINAATTFSVGWANTSVTATNVSNASTALESTTGTVPVTPDTSSVAGTPGQYLTITLAGTLTSNPNFYVDVLGYFTTTP